MRSCLAAKQKDVTLTAVQLRLRLPALSVSHIGKNYVIASDVKAMMSIELTSKCLPMFSQRRLDLKKIGDIGKHF